MNAASPPLCVRCSHYERIKTLANPLYSISPHICHAFVDLVTGDPLALPARDVRARDGGCGPAGARFEGAGVRGWDPSSGAIARSEERAFSQTPHVRYLLPTGEGGPDV